MAGDWIKMRMDLHRHPKVVRIMSALNADRLRAIGGLHAVWCIFDEHSQDGRLDGYTPRIMDDMIGWKGFCQAMIDVGWLTYSTTEGLAVPNFDTHNGDSAKRRATEAERKRSSRKTSAERPQNVRTECGQKADQRREEKNNTPIAPKGALQLRAESIFRNDPNTPLTPKEVRAFARALPAIQATSEADWQLLEQFYAAPQSETYSRKDLAGLLNNWNGEIDRARTWAGGKAEPSTEIKTRLVAL